MSSPAEDFVTILTDSTVAVGSLAASSGWSVHLSCLPDDGQTPDTCIACYDKGGVDPEPHDILRPSVQVLVRGDVFGYRAAWTKAAEIRDALHERVNETWNGTRYIQIMCRGDIIDMGYDEKNRPMLSVNFEVQRTS